ncbi:hypothetical protein [Brunnivagina elsteri]|uniref:Uncharacterized protein n=1 Tax=Brunnivagina elsteri CCALA 953 TaxID=987040 RepID=A0A2A2TQJ1_9CYAN|nr:hypothetical protein [Calothrix elsteri]PAX60712.1 hypothetical protein CK510_00430 [Calothrix elsteri CCALA 953]
MNSDLMPSPEPSKPSKTNKDQTSIETPKEEVLTQEQTPQEENSLVINSDNAEDDKFANRHQPIPPPSEPMQYRAIGLVRGRYVASEEQFTQGSLISVDGIELSSVLLGRIMSLVKNHLDLEQDHLWVVYPRTRQEDDELHLQIVGVWEPEKLAKDPISEEEGEKEEKEEEKPTESETSPSEALTPSSDIPDGGFSIRGEVVYQTPDCNSLVIKIKQAPRKKDDKPKYFKLKIKGKLDARAVGKFWDLQVKREGDSLMIEKGEAIADLPKKRRPPFKAGAGGGGRRPFNRAGGGGGIGVGSKKPFRRPPGGETPRPVKKDSADPSTVSSVIPKPMPNPSRPTPKPVKRAKPEDE